VTRIISGAAGSLPLATPAHGTRPTSDRVREALFSSLEAEGLLSGAHVADLYAGSGALGLEALSRGAHSAVLVESSRSAAQICRRNAAAVADAIAGPRATVAAIPVRRWLGQSSGTFDLVFLDPPYALAETELAADLRALPRLLSSEATVVVERSSRSPEPELPESLTLRRSKRYGETVLWILERTGAAEPRRTAGSED
jgi:16S rRNA (guanine966-N2)-methyltransferase